MTKGQMQQSCIRIPSGLPATIGTSHGAIKLLKPAKQISLPPANIGLQLGKPMGGYKRTAARGRSVGTTSPPNSKTMKPSGSPARSMAKSAQKRRAANLCKPCLRPLPSSPPAWPFLTASARSSTLIPRSWISPV